MSAGGPGGDHGDPVGDPGPFRPAPLLGGFHRQTLAGSLLRAERPRSRPTVRERLVRVSAETRVLALESGAARRQAPTLVTVHGMSGSARSTYMQAVQRKAHRLGWRVLLLNLRGALGTEHLSVTGYHGGLTDDLAALLDDLDGAGPRLLLGFSLGGNVVLRLAAEAAGRWPLAGVAAVSPAVDLARCARALDGERRLAVYRDHFLVDLADHVRRRAAVHGGRVVTAGLDEVRTLTAFDDRFTAREHGFAGVDDYYARASAAPLLGRIDVPTLVVHARDDHLVPAEGLTTSPAMDNPRVTVELTDRGGHCAFLSRRGAWAEDRCLAFLRTLVGTG